MCGSPSPLAGPKAMAEQGITSFLNPLSTDAHMTTFRSLQAKGELTARASFAIELRPAEAADPDAAIAATGGDEGFARHCRANGQALSRRSASVVCENEIRVFRVKLMRAARDRPTGRPDFPMQAALAALHWMSMGHEGGGGPRSCALSFGHTMTCALPATSSTDTTITPFGICSPQPQIAHPSPSHAGRVVPGPS